MRSHAANGPIKDFGRRAMVKGTGFLGIHDVTFVEEIVVTKLRDILLNREMHRGRTHLVAEKAAGDVNLLASHNDNFLPRENLLGDYGSQSTKEMTFAVNYDGR